MKEIKELDLLKIKFHEDMYQTMAELSEKGIEWFDIALVILSENPSFETYMRFKIREMDITDLASYQYLTTLVEKKTRNFKALSEIKTNDTLFKLFMLHAVSVKYTSDQFAFKLKDKEDPNNVQVRFTLLDDELERQGISMWNSGLMSEGYGCRTLYTKGSVDYRIHHEHGVIVNETIGLPDPYFEWFFKLLTVDLYRNHPMSKINWEMLLPKPTTDYIEVSIQVPDDVKRDVIEVRKDQPVSVLMDVFLNLPMYYVYHIHKNIDNYDKKSRHQSEVYSRLISAGDNGLEYTWKTSSESIGSRSHSTLNDHTTLNFYHNLFRTIGIEYPISTLAPLFDVGNIRVTERDYVRDSGTAVLAPFVIP